MPKLFSLITSYTLFLLILSCASGGPQVKPALNAYQLDLIAYFKEVALGLEFGNASQITRKWERPMKIYVGGDSSLVLRSELENIQQEINALASDGFQMETVQDSAQSNFYIFLGTGEAYAQIYPNQSNFVENNWGLFSIFWDGNQHIYRGYMYVDTQRADAVEQRHLLREELTQSLGLARDSPLYLQSIFQSAWTFTTQYAPIDTDVIRLLYHPDMSVGLDAEEVDAVLTDILSRE